MQFDWDGGNEGHVARHGVGKAEVEEAVIDPLGQIVEYEVVDGEARYRQIGATIRGRLLIVVFTIRSNAIRPITSFDADSHTAREYRQGSKE